ncbi:MFS transporter [Candidatus Woesearchaeota archaeon]|nr:MFS transporter [Candidatus Woesearchaeota archaeon]
MAFIFRSLSAIMLKNYYEPRLKLEKEYYFTFLQFIKNIPKSNFGKFVVFVSLSTLATQIASPFFAVYMLRELNFSYTFWISTVISSILASLLFMPIWGKFTDKYGTVKTLKITGIFTPLVPFLWLLSPLLYKINFYLLLAYIIIVESFSGFIWAGFNLAAGNFIYDAVTRQRMALCIAYFSVINSIGFFIGASFGGIVSSMSSIPFGISPLIFVFFISGIARFLVYIFVSPTIKEVRTVKDLDIKNMHKDLLDFKPKKILNHLK